jgi:hypothetical protein
MFSESMRKGLPVLIRLLWARWTGGIVPKKFSAPYRSGPSLDQDEELEQPGDDPGARSRMVIGIMAEE